jgi:hypothetical protein
LVRDRANDFIAAVQKLRQEPLLWKRLSSAARAKIEGGYTNEQAAEKWKDLFTRLQQNAGPRSTLAVPGHLGLPPLRPSLAREDSRRPAIFVMIPRKIKTAARVLRDDGPVTLLRKMVQSLKHAAAIIKDGILEQVR